jgi:hypothetical protein
MKPIEFLTYYKKYLIGDIDTMIEKADQESEGNQMAVPITFSIFSCLDIFGFLMRNTDNDMKKIKSELTKSKQNISYSILKWNYFGFSNDETDMILKFIEIYRHGIMHTFFPKDFSISNKKEDESYELFYKVGDNLVFNVRKFYLCFKSFIEHLDNELLNNKLLNEQIEKNINLAFAKDISFSDFYKNISKIEKFNNQYSPTTTVETTPSPIQIINTDDMNITGSLG